MNGRLCGWCITGFVRPEFLADRAADCPGCAQHRAYKEAVAKPTDCTKNPYHLCESGQRCLCECHVVSALLPRTQTHTLILRKRKSNAHHHKTVHR